MGREGLDVVTPKYVICMQQMLHENFWPRKCACPMTLEFIAGTVGSLLEHGLLAPKYSCRIQLRLSCINALSDSR
jgi:hypothetical protein